MKVLMYSLLLAGLTGCVAMPVQHNAALEAELAGLSFDAATHSVYAMPGTGEIRGQAFLRQNGGGVVTCAGQQVLVMPDTYYFRSLIGAARSGAKFNTDQPAKSLLHTTQCDAQGNFTASGLSSGRWIVTTEVVWMVGYARQGGGVLKSVDVTSGAVSSVLLTDEDRVGR